MRDNKRILVVIAIAACTSALSSCTPRRNRLTTPPEQLRDGMKLIGTFQQVNGVNVLILRGDPYQRGYAQGWFCARGILDMVDAICGSNLLLSDRRDYERLILPLMDRFIFAPDDVKELKGILAGVKARLGSDAVLKRLGRPLTLKDLKAYNTAGDWYRQACASFAAWGSRAKNGHVWIGRNFDFMPSRAFFAHQMIVVHKRLGTKRAWATVIAPGMIGCITGINERGVFAAVNDVFMPLRPVGDGYSPRLLVLRRLMENCDARNLQPQALAILETRRQMFDNAIMLAGAVKDATPPAIVLEYNGDRTRDRGVTVRTSKDNEKKLSGEMITCTNHFRKRARPVANLANYRYPLMRRVLMAKTNRGEKVDFDIARKTMGAVRLPITVHTVILDLNTLDFWYAAGEYLSPPGNRDFVKLPMKKWLSPD